MTRFKLLAGMAIIALAVIACDPKMIVALASTRERLPKPRFVITEADRPRERPRYHSVSVVEEEPRRVLWEIVAEPFGDQASLSSLTYGIVPAGFITRTATAATLAPGKKYAIIVSGTANGGMRFEVDSAGNVKPD